MLDGRNGEGPTMTWVSYGSCGSATLIWNTAFQSSAFTRSVIIAQDVYIPSPSSLTFFGSSSLVPVELLSPFSSETPFPPKGGSKRFNWSRVSRYSYHDRSTIKAAREGRALTRWSLYVMDLQSHCRNTVDTDKYNTQRL